MMVIPFSPAHFNFYHFLIFKIHYYKIQKQSFWKRLCSWPQGKEWNKKHWSQKRRWTRLTTLKLRISGTPMVVQWLRLRASTAGGMGSIPHQGTKKKKKKKEFLWNGTVTRVKWHDLGEAVCNAYPRRGFLQICTYKMATPKEKQAKNLICYLLKGISNLKNNIWKGTESHLVIKRIEIKTTMRYHYTPTRLKTNIY